MTYRPEIDGLRALISYDGIHLTPAGAAFVAKFAFDQGPLAPFAGRRTEPARRADTLSTPLATSQDTTCPENIKETK